jgi:hypothetical protein
MPLSQKQLEDVCLLYGGNYKTCRYLRPDDSNYGHYQCCKLRPKEKTKIDLKIKEWFRSCKKKGLDPTTQGAPLGDNCAGYPILQIIEVGYDKDK